MKGRAVELKPCREYGFHDFKPFPIWDRMGGCYDFSDDEYCTKCGKMKGDES